MSVAKVQEALDKLEVLDDLLQDISPALISQSNWEELTHEKLKSLRRILENELVHQEKKLIARMRQSNTGLQADGVDGLPKIDPELLECGHSVSYIVYSERRNYCGICDADARRKNPVFGSPRRR